MEPECPKCSLTPLQEVRLESGVVADECPACGGRWFDFGELAKSSKDPEKFREASASGLLKPRPGTSACPKCSETMQNGGLLSELLRVDYCPKCMGMWLDKHELPLIDRLL